MRGTSHHCWWSACIQAAAKGHGQRRSEHMCPCMGQALGAPYHYRLGLGALYFYDLCVVHFLPPSGRSCCGRRIIPMQHPNWCCIGCPCTKSDVCRVHSTAPTFYISEFYRSGFLSQKQQVHKPCCPRGPHVDTSYVRGGTGATHHGSRTTVPCRRARYYLSCQFRQGDVG